MKALLALLIFLFSPLTQAQVCTYHQLVALKDITNCAERGDRIAQYMIGQIYFLGKEVPRNYEKSFRWTFKSAQQGDKDAQAQLGFDYYNGWGVKKDHVLAYMWWSLSKVNNDNQIMNDYLASLESELTKDQLTKAQNMASNWLTKYQSINGSGY